MCTHQYKHYQLGEKNPTCRLDYYFNQESSSEAIPVDREGLCIFHSNDIEWKKENTFAKLLKKLLDYHRQRGESADLREVHFVTDQDKDAIDYVDILTGTLLTGSTFHHMICGQHLTLTEELAFKDCRFEAGIVFSDCVFEDDVSFDEIIISNPCQIPLFLFEKCEFRKYFYGILEEGSVNFSFRNCSFDAVQLERINTHKELGAFELVHCEVETFEMTDSVLYAWIDFSGTGFTTGEFTDVAFRGETSFKDIRVENNLKFQGGDHHSVFEGITNFNINWNELKGELNFERANLSNILKPHKDLLLEYEKQENGKVKIGAGCIKYRIMTPDLTYHIKDEHHFLISEIGTSFATYFTQHNGFNLGIEVRNKTRQNITLFYFTDEDLSQEEFINMLGTTSARIFGILSEDSAGVSLREDAMINFQIDMIRSFTKAAHQIHKGNWSQSDSKAFFGPITLSPQIQLNEQMAHIFLESIRVPEILAQLQQINIVVNQHGEKALFINEISGGNTTFKDHEKPNNLK